MIHWKRFCFICEQRCNYNYGDEVIMESIEAERRENKKIIRIMLMAILLQVTKKFLDQFTSAVNGYLST